MNLSDDEMVRLKELLRLDAHRRQNVAKKEFHRETLRQLRYKVKKSDETLSRLTADVGRRKGKRRVRGVRVGMCACGCSSVYWVPGKPPVKIVKDGVNIIYAEPACLQRLLRVNGAREPLRKVA